MMQSIDLNADVGEGFGAYSWGQDAAILDFVTSANIACGFHAGDPATMRRTVRLAVDKGVAMGAHPGLPDLVGFGRRELAVSAEETYELVVYQVGALHAFVTAAGAVLRHVKPHGALYNMAARRQDLAAAVATAVRDVDRQMTLFGLSGSELIRAGRNVGLSTASEVFADRTYQSDGSLTPRSRPDAVIADVDQSTAQALRMIRDGRVRSCQGDEVLIQADTVCLHGDSPHAMELARQLRGKLESAGIAVRATPPRSVQ
jgi:5-oxoprolinase (ATP-hydrolysing) subunit A